MNTTIDKLNGLKNTKQAIKQAIIDKGVAVDEAATFASYASKIGEITTGDPGTPQIPKITCWDTKQSFDEKGYSILSQIKSIDWTEFNKLKLDSGSYLFRGWPSNYVDLKNLDTSTFRTFKEMFTQSKLKRIDVSNFKINPPEDNYLGVFEAMFNACWDLEEIIGLNKWDISSCKALGRSNGFTFMFKDCKKLKNLDLSSWTTHQLESMQAMFSGCEALTTLNISNLNTDSIIYCNDTFLDCESLMTVNWPENLFPNINVKELDLAGYTWSPIAKLSHETILDLFNKLATRDNAPVLKLWNVQYDACTPEEIKIATNKGWTVTRVE